ncbi:hypothetical protein C7S18_17240 [Ahniella affigens]|uniref:Uncharacterized protein n=1 Tax=Ahniella affigens TaxID=2021234 RepID=A0A2P1PVE0_9GAMM|nr:hypothetical protein [Ahniella affigens]AVP98817.1 hypothetical protein C7S18_17240 [Ahniella affigens]
MFRLRWFLLPGVLWFKLLLITYCCLGTGAAHAVYAPVMPTNLQLLVQNPASFPQNGYIVRSGVPLARSQQLLSTNDLAVVNDQGLAVPATFRVLARWGAGRSQVSAPIQWVLVSFPASVPAQSARSYRLSIDGSVTNPVSGATVTVSSTANAFQINTGAAQFEVPKHGLGVLSQASAGSGNTPLVGSSFELIANGVTYNSLLPIRRAELVSQDRLSAVIVVSAPINMPEIGNGRLALTRRYVFRAGASSVDVRASLAFEGDRCGNGVITCDGSPNGVQVSRWRERLQAANDTSSPLLGMRATRGQSLFSSNLTTGQTAGIRQLQRSNRLAAYQYTWRRPDGSVQTGSLADGAALLRDGPEGVIGVAIKSMHQYEPQALQQLSTTDTAIDLIDGPIWLGLRQGMFAEYAVHIGAPGTTLTDHLAAFWPDLQHSMQALPNPAWIAATGAVDEFPVGPLPSTFAGYDTVLTDTLNLTRSLRESRGLYGLMTHGLFPRFFGDPIRTDEIDCGDNDPTPADDVDDTYWCATWTDYHNAASTAVVAAFRYQDSNYLSDLATPAALRALHTLVYQCAPDDQNFYCGQAPAGYNGYRSDFNASHQYLENLILYYWLSGDESVPETLARGADTFRAYLCPGRNQVPQGPVCGPNTLINDPDARLNGRVTSQFLELFRFVGLASDDASFLDDWTSTSARNLTQHYVESQHLGDTIGFIEPSGGYLPDGSGGDFSIVTGAGTYYSTQLWMTGLYDLTMLYRLIPQQLDPSLGSPGVRPSQVLNAHARLITHALQVPPADGTVNGILPESMRIGFSGARLGGNVMTLEPGWTPGAMPTPCLDACHYLEGKAALAALMLRAADQTNAATLRSTGEALTQLGIQLRLASPQPLNKAVAIGLTRLHAAVARAAGTTEPPQFQDSFE